MANNTNTITMSMRELDRLKVVAATREAQQQSIGRGDRRSGTLDHPRSLRGFRADTGVREALGMPRHSPRQGNGAPADKRTFENGFDIWVQMDCHGRILIRHDLISLFYNY
ncbi:hypothetical protein [Burkholderia ubonensis]|uniref:hypothetical protein n=1 Tax=Burkholderia ubonensis TaxID=101571 RepID=UPI0039F61282